MKTLVPIFAAFGLFLVGAAAPLSAAQKEKTFPKERATQPTVSATPRGSIRPKGTPNATERSALAKINFQVAFNAAVAAVPGRVTYGELEVQDGNLQYSFQIITINNKVMDVSIDAGDGKVLSIDDGDDE